MHSNELCVSTSAACGFAGTRAEKMVLLIPFPGLCVRGSLRVQAEVGLGSGRGGVCLQE